MPLEIAMQHKYVSVARTIVAAMVLAAIAACAAQSQNSGTLPATSQNPLFRAGIPNAAATPPVTAPVTIPYPYTDKYTTTTYASATSKGKTTTTDDTGTTTVKFSLDKKTGVYDVPEIIKSKLGYSETLNSAITFPPYKGGTAQIILSDNYVFTEGTFLETGLDTYPQGENSFDFPLTTGRTWSAAANHLSSFNQSLPGKHGFDENSSVNELADGEYTGQLSFSSTAGAANQDNFGSTTAVTLSTPSLYTLSLRAAGFNPLTQTFDLPSSGKIAVKSSGKGPLPVKRGTVKVPDWYPAPGTLPSVLYSDNFKVMGTATTPSTCGSRAGVSATEVVEKFANLDPVQGFYDTYTATYYLQTLAKGQFWFSCIIESYTSDTYANGWVLSKGSWGGYTQQQIGTETLIAGTVKPANVAIGAGRIPLIPFPSAVFRNRGAIDRALPSL
jgi:hypothetical protein